MKMSDFILKTSSSNLTTRPACQNNNSEKLTQMQPKHRQRERAVYNPTINSEINENNKNKNV